LSYVESSASHLPPEGGAGGEAMPCHIISLPEGQLKASLHCIAGEANTHLPARQALALPGRASHTNKQAHALTSPSACRAGEL